MVLGGAEGSRGYIGQIVEGAKRVVVLPRVVKEKASTALVGHNERVGKKLMARRQVESALTNLGKGRTNGERHVHIISVLDALRVVVDLEVSDLSPAQRKLLEDSDTMTPDGKRNLGRVFQGMSEDLEDDITKRRIRKDPVRRRELQRRVGALLDAADYLDTTRKASSE